MHQRTKIDIISNKYNQLLVNTTMSSSLTIRELFYDTFDSFSTDESRLQFLRYARAMDHPFHLEPQPGAIIARFYRGTAPAMDVAQMFIECFPDLIICREASCCMHKPQTIMDSFEFHIEHAASLDETERILDIIEALRNLGIKNTSEYDSAELREAYMRDPAYQMASLDQGWSFDVSNESEPNEDTDDDELLARIHPLDGFIL